MVYSSLNYISYCNCAENATCTDLEVKINDSKIKLIDFMNNGTKYIDENKGLMSKGVMVLGISGTGKSTLINYLIGRKLKCVWKKPNWVLDLVDQTESFKIGHKIDSKTLYPEFVYLEDEDVSFIDNPGFADTRGDQIDIANAFFRDHVGKKVEKMKIVILLSFWDILERGDQFRKSLKELKRIFGVLEREKNDDPTLEIKLSESIAFVVTKVTFEDNENDLDMITSIQSLLENIINSESENQNLNLFETNIYKSILNKTRIAIFSNPRKNVIIDDREKNNILKMIRDMNYIKTKKLKIQSKISDSSLKKLIKSIGNCFQSIENKLENILYKNISNLFKLDIEQEFSKNNKTKLQIIFNTTSKFAEKCFKKIKFEHLLSSITENILDSNSKKSLSIEHRILKFFTELVPHDLNQFISDEREWLKSHLLSHTNELVTKFKENLKNLLEKEKLVLFEAIGNSFENFIKSSILNAYSSSDLEVCKYKLQLSRNKIEFSSNLSSILENVDEEIIQESLKKIMIKIIKFKTFLNVSDEIEIQTIKLKLKEIIDKKVNTLIDISTSKSSVSVDKDQLYFRGHFATLSDIFRHINVNRNVSLKTINIFLKYSLEMDENSKISRVIYSTHVPDLVIITPKVFVNKTISIDLSCESTLEPYKVKAKDGSFFGESGSDGEPGKPGYNGGRLFIFAKSAKYTNLSIIKFISKGGNGGQGQNGGDGHDGRDAIAKKMDKTENCFEILKMCSENLFYFINTDVRKCISHQCKEFIFLKRVDQKPGDNFYFRHYLYPQCIKGGSGGYGGEAGLPGLNGFMYIQTLEDKRTLEYTESFGENGKNGVDGRQGRNGFYKNIDYVFYAKFMSTYLVDTDSSEGFCYGHPKQKEPKNQDKPSKFSELQFYKISNEYIDFFLGNDAIKNFKMINVLDFIYEFEKDQNLDINGILERVKMLKLFKSNNLLSKFRDQIQIYLSKSTQINNNESLILNYALTVVTSYMSLLKTDHSSSIILDIGKYLDITLDQIKYWKSFKIQEIIQLYKKSYQDNLAVKIKESTKAIKYIEERIDSLTMNLNKNIVNIFDEISNQKEEIRKNIDKLKEHKDQLENSLLVKASLGFLKMFTGLLSIAGPKGALVGGCLQTGLDIGQQSSGNQFKFKNTNVQPNIENQVKDLKANIQKKLDAAKDDEEKAKKLQLHLQKLNVLPAINSFTLRGLDLISENRIANQEVQEVVMEINKNTKQLDGLRDVENNLNTYYNEILKKDINSLLSFDNLNDPNSTMVLSFHSYDLKSKFDDLKKNLFILLDGFKNKLETEQIFQSLENSIDTIYEISRQIENFRQHIELGNYIETVTNTEKNFLIPVTYQSDVNSMRMVLSENFIRERVKESFKAFSYWSFPFYCDYIKQSTNIAESNNNTDEKMLIYDETINNIKSIVNNHKININFNIDNYLINFIFDNESSLFKWSSRDFPFEVEQLFFGNFSTFYSDVKSSSYNAVKVSKIGIKIECQSRKLNEKLDEILSKFQVIMIHNGESNYRVLDKFYKFNSLTREQLELEYSYGCHLYSKCDIENESFRKLSENTPSISPFTLWRIKLVPKNKDPIK
ncbi:unnamed protein product [Brachionus calyciflorus]|uniref:G domain-containing protein n=1 Tax=Brachionus calyciflorus TaxID=104777 RepID=A0A814EUI4_9BILA|nr:unnamed protein product [Brachionus calyciflorus]